MVMEAPPSPQSVGREFVRQYYTLLNKAPTHLHRFYNNQSSFVHGGLDPPNRETSPVIGQKQIHQKIQQLNFRDCHAKITQVDAQATLGNGVVVQVTGELSNAGQPMRRFTQTFVLAAQSPKKYYVHNDIFRYQDEIVSDDECEPESRSEIEDELVQERPVLGEVSQIAQQPIPYYNPATAPLQPNLTPVPPHHGQPPTTLAHVLPAQPVATINGSLHPDDINVISAGQLSPAVPAVQGQGLAAPMGNLQSGLTSSSPLTASDENRPVPEESPVDASLDTNYAISQDVLSTQELNQDTVLSNEPKTYATLLKSGGGAAAYSGVAPMTVFNPPPKSLSPPLSQSHYENRDLPPATAQVGNQSSGSLGQRMGVNRGSRNNQPRIPRQDSRSGKNSFTDDGPNYEDRRKSQGHRDTSFGDSHQLFLGNLPHSATEDELREIFSAFGPIVDLRIQPSTKGNSSGPRAPPNYGFITYENQQAVQNCLAAKPIRYPNNDKNGTVLNVEEKKTKDRLPYGGNRGGPDNLGGPRSRDNGPRRPGTARGGGGSIGGPGGRPNNFNRPPPNRSANNTYNNRR